VEVVLFLIPFVVLGSAAIFIAFSGGPGKAREAYLTRGNRTFRLVMLVLYVVLGVGVPVAIIAARGNSLGAGRLAATAMTPEQTKGKALFMANCATCHSLAAVGAHGVTGPNLDTLGEVPPERVLGAIKNGGTGQGRMPSGLLEGADAQAVADYVSSVAGKAR
jgi:mono/diheme cytochrome c family protein